MLLEFLLDTVLTIWENILTLFEDLPAWTGTSIDIVVPVPVLTSVAIAQLNAWFATSIAVVGVLALGNVIQWIYAMIPFKAT